MAVMWARAHVVAAKGVTLLAFVWGMLLGLGVSQVAHADETSDGLTLLETYFADVGQYGFGIPEGLISGPPPGASYACLVVTGVEVVGEIPPFEGALPMDWECGEWLVSGETGFYNLEIACETYQPPEFNCTAGYFVSSAELRIFGVPGSEGPASSAAYTGPTSQEVADISALLAGGLAVVVFALGVFQGKGVA